MRYLAGLIIFLSILSCGDNQGELDEAIILEYIADNNLDAMKTNEGVYFIIDEPGSNERPSSSSSVEVCYKGYKLDGSIFDSTYTSNDQCDKSITFPLTAVIDGWQIGIPLFGRAGKGTLIIPSTLGYGSTGQGSIGPNTILVFDIHLIDFM